MFMKNKTLQKLQKELDKMEEKTKKQAEYLARVESVNADLQQENMDLHNDNQELHSTIRQAVLKMDEFDYKTMNIYTFLRNIKIELSSSLDN